MQLPDWKAEVDRYYPQGAELRDVYLKHCASVASLALETLDKKCLSLDRKSVEAAAMLHDIGIFLTSAPGIFCNGEHPYILHGVLGADLLRRDGWPECIAAVAERHTGAGMTPEEIRYQCLPLPFDRDYCPHTMLERLICWADKFFSKSGDMRRKSLEQVRDSLARHGADSLARFDELNAEFA